MEMLRWLRSAWRSRQRQMDVMILWPRCRKQAASIEAARAVFAAHVFHDKAWSPELDDEHIKRIVAALE